MQNNNNIYGDTRLSKRILNEIKNLKTKPSDFIYATALENNIYEWHFTLKGMEGSCYENGLYHGVVILPNEYPMKGPDIRFLTKNGRFEVNKNICLSVTSYHPESWSPLWKVRNVLESLNSFFITDAAGIGSIKKSDSERKTLAAESHNFVCSKCGPVSE